MRLELTLVEQSTITFTPSSWASFTKSKNYELPPSILLGSARFVSAVGEAWGLR